MTNITYLITPWSRDLLEKLTSSQLVKKFPSFYGTLRFITTFIHAHHLSLSWACLIQSLPPTSHFLKIDLNIIPSMPGSSKWSLSLRFPHLNPVYASPIPHKRYMPCPSHSSQCNHLNNTGWGVEIIKLLVTYFPPLPFYLIPLRPKYSPQHSILKHLQTSSFHNVSDQVSQPYKTVHKIIVLYIWISKVLDSKLKNKRFCTEW